MIEQLPSTGTLPAYFALTARVLADEGERAWMQEALCGQTDPEAFFPDKGGSTRDAKRICKSCDVQLTCLGYALEHDERFGVWGGASERERRRMKQERRS